MKDALRRQALAARGQGGDQAAATARLMDALAPWRGAVLAGYWPIRDEIDPRPAMRAHDGPLCLPVVVGRARPLIFRAWQDDLIPGSFGTAHPAPDAPEMRPDVLIVPLVGFDDQGNRIGYGGGYYDRTLHLLRESGPVIAIGFAYEVQRLPAIPTEPTDQPLDLVVTDVTLRRPDRA